MSFEEHHEVMGLEKKGEGTYYYADRYGEVVYKQLTTKGDSGILDDHDLQSFGLFSKGIDPDEDFYYSGNLSDSYQFIGHDTINETIRTSIEEHGSPIFREDPMFSMGRARMFNNIVIQNETNVPRAGDVYPMLVVKNSYDGSLSAKVAFGLRMGIDNNKVDFSFSMGEMKQVHLQNTDAKLQASVGSYIDSFSGNITSLITDSFNNLLTEEEVLGVLDLVEKTGKKRRKEVSKILEELVGSEDNGIQSWGTSSFNLFLAITKYSTVEKNLNAKTLLENVAERVLTVPPQLLDLLEPPPL